MAHRYLKVHTKEMMRTNTDRTNSAKTVWPSARTLGLVAGLAVFTSGCLIIPTPHFDSGHARSNFNKRSLRQIEPGVTSREQVLLQFGEPDAVSSDRRKIAYRSEKVVAYWIAAGGYQASGGTLTKDCYLVVEFDERGVVRNRKMSTHWLFPVPVDSVMVTKGWQEESGAAIDKASMISGRGEWFPNVDGFETIAGGLVIGYLGLTPEAIVFRDRTQSGDSEPRWVLPYQGLKDCRLAKFVLARRVVVRTLDNQVHSFSFTGPHGIMQDEKKTRAAYEFIEGKMANRSHVNDAVRGISRK
jgi:outer membrane protein assembly factor BamE (lipoprotein component of BamABCDE complex)